MLTFGRALVLFAAIACDEPVGEPVQSPARERAPTPAESRARGDRTSAAQPTHAAPEDAFDPRLLVVDESAHAGEERVCHVAFAETPTPVTGRERERYAFPVVRRVAVQCAAGTTRSWADLVFGEATAASAERIEAGTIARVRAAAPDGGFAGYPVLELVAIEGAAPVPPAPPEPASPEPAFDFGRAGDPGVARGERPCAIDFASRIERVDDRTRARHGYPDAITHRVALKCLHASGDAWVDLVLDAAEARRALGVARGDTIPLRVVAAEGGYAGRPVVRLPNGA